MLLNVDIISCGGGKTYIFEIFFFSFPVYLAPWKKGLIAVVVIAVIIAVLLLGARFYFLKKSKGEHSLFIPFCQALLPGNQPRM